MDLISVIVPVYNVEKYLRKCVDSILAQTYTNLEIILVDDGSPDNCGKICDEYAAKDSRIKVIHQENGGLSAARNAGLDVATGDYIGFVDSDDYIAPDMYEKLYQAIEIYNSDIALCGFKKFELESRTEVYEKKLLYRDEFLKELLLENIKSYAWNKLYKKSLFDNVRFPEGELFEDLKIMHLIGEKVSAVSFTNKILYYYRIRQGSITFNNRGLNADDYIAATHDRSERYKKTEFYHYAVAGEFRCIRVVVSEMSLTNSNDDTYKQLFKESKKLYRICKHEIKGFQKVLTLLYLLSPKLYKLIRKQYSRIQLKEGRTK